MLQPLLVNLHVVAAVALLLEEVIHWDQKSPSRKRFQIQKPILKEKRQPFDTSPFGEMDSRSKTVLCNLMTILKAQSCSKHFNTGEYLKTGL